jgi:hypothetical protein
MIVRSLTKDELVNKIRKNLLIRFIQLTPKKSSAIIKDRSETPRHAMVFGMNMSLSAAISIFVHMSLTSRGTSNTVVVIFVCLIFIFYLSCATYASVRSRQYRSH